MATYEYDLDRQINEKEWRNAKCDKYDYMIAAFCGFAAGLIDSFFVGTPGNSRCTGSENCKYVMEW